MPWSVPFKRAFIGVSIVAIGVPLVILALSGYVTDSCRAGSCTYTQSDAQRSHQSMRSAVRHRHVVHAHVQSEEQSFKYSMGCLYSINKQGDGQCRACKHRMNGHSAKTMLQHDGSLYTAHGV